MPGRAGSAGGKGSDATMRGCQGTAERARALWALTKPLQTGLLLVTGLAGYGSVRCPVYHAGAMVGLAGSLFLAVAGSTMLNMVADRDIDACMERTARRPLPAGKVTPGEALAVGLGAVGLGVAWGLAMDVPYGLVLLAGALLDAVVYTLWLKRRTPWSILWGGIAGGMPVLAGRTLGVGAVDLAGVLLALAVLLWIPSHILTFSMRHAGDYRRAGVPVLPNARGERFARITMGASTAGAVVALMLAAWRVGLRWGYVHAAAALSAVLLGLVVVSIVRPSARLDFGVYKFASIYMLGTMALIAAGA